MVTLHKDPRPQTRGSPKRRAGNLDGPEPHSPPPAHHAPQERPGPAFALLTGLTPAQLAAVTALFLLTATGAPPPSPARRTDHG